MTATCPCGRPVDGASLCDWCVHTLRVAVANISVYYAELDIVKARLTRYSAPTGGGKTPGREIPMPIADAFTDWTKDHADATAVTRNTLTTWCRDLAEYTKIDLPNDTVPAMCRWLLTYSDRLRTALQGPEALDELTSLERMLRRIIDRPPSRWYAGPCEQCQADLYVAEGKKHAQCGGCGLPFDVAQRRAYLLAVAEDRLADATTIARAVSWFGEEPLTAERVRQWAARRRLPAKSTSLDGKPMYRIGDAIDLLAQSSARRTVA